jgi:hypothetical protein
MEQDWVAARQVQMIEHPSAHLSWPQWTVPQTQDAGGWPLSHPGQLQEHLGGDLQNPEQRGLHHRLPAMVQAMRKVRQDRRELCREKLENTFFDIVNHFHFIVQFGLFGNSPRICKRKIINNKV